MKNQMDSIAARLDKLELAAAVTTKSLTELPVLYDSVEDLYMKIEELESALLAATSGQILTDKDQQVVLQARDNNINSMLRAVMYSLMGLTSADSSLLPDPVDKPNHGGRQFWVPSGIPDELVLRPDFTNSWTKNNWHKAFVDKVRQDGHTLYPSCSKEVISGLSEKDILQRGSRTTFKHLKEKYSAQGKSAKEKELERKFKRRDVRKKTKSILRSAVREEYPELKAPQYDFVFDPAWQSTDCSTDLTSDSDGGDSLDDDDSPKIKKLKSWPPDYREDAFLELVDDIHIRSTRRVAAQKKKPRKTTGNQYVMVRAKKKTRPALSIPRLDGGPKMLSCFIKEAWADELSEGSRAMMAPFVYGSDDDGYKSEWEEFPHWEKVEKVTKKGMRVTAN
ncbi:hypothetical protein FB451DRAFT_1408613 [Mycena latifolia]|nr:hypothetical protein FB451DRAFT_1408613 [Mycena latifolia]